MTGARETFKTMLPLTPEACYRAFQAHDVRFDGRIYVGVTSTGIYCRPICPARSPKFENCRYFISAAAAQTAGFRPCLRCRPEIAPELTSFRGTSNTVSRALALIAEGALDADSDVASLAARLGVGERHLRRLFQQHLGAPPVAVAQTRRVLFAKQLIQETHMPMAQVAFASGFRSLRRFNETFQTLFQRPPSALRRKTLPTDASAPITLNLTYRPPYDWESMLAFLEARAVAGVESLTNGAYHRTFKQDGVCGTIEVVHAPARNSLKATIRMPRIPSMRTLPLIVARLRCVFDLAADIAAIDSHLARDPLLAPLIALRPGLRAPGSWDGFELAVRAVLGQQITVEAARHLAARLVSICGDPLASFSNSLTRLFPTADQVASADLSAIGMPASRRATLHAVANAALADSALFEACANLPDALARLRSIHGVGVWTAEYIALRALREPDAFPASDIALLRRAAALSGTHSTPADLLERAVPWRPWRAYAAQHLWTSGVPCA